MIAIVLTQVNSPAAESETANGGSKLTQAYAREAHPRCSWPRGSTACRDREAVTPCPLGGVTPCPCRRGYPLTLAPQANDSRAAASKTANRGSKRTQARRTRGVHGHVAPQRVPRIRLRLEERGGHVRLARRRVRSLPHVVLKLHVLSTPVLLVHVVHIRHELASITVDAVVNMLGRPDTGAPHVAVGEAVQARHFGAAAGARAAAEAG